jgi:type IV secretory pathway VirB10-like protein
MAAIEPGSAQERDKRRTAVLWRIAASFVFVMLVYAGVHAQDAKQPPPPDPPTTATPPPDKQDGPPPNTDTQPPPETLPPPEQQPPPTTEPPPPTQPPPTTQVQPSQRCGAVAYTADGAFGGAYGIDTCEEAARLAIDECRRESTDKEDCARGVVRRTDSWFLIQFCSRGGSHATHVSTGRTLAEVNEAAALYARSSPQGPGYCRMVPSGLFHSAGLHTKM